MQNKEIRFNAKKANMKLWKIADKLNVTDSTFSKMLRKELPTEKKEKILKIIANYSQEVTTND